MNKPRELFRSLLVLTLCICIVATQSLGGMLEPFRFFNNITLPFMYNEVRFLPEYDFIVVGAGSGGSVIANRLSENNKWSVLLLEAGKEENFITDIPLMAAFQASTSYNWGYRTEKMPTCCLGVTDKRCVTPRGKALGGTSVINFLIYTRGNKRDFDEWEKMGNTDWGYKSVLKYFIKSEDCSKCSSIDKDYHGYNGYLKVEDPPYRSQLLKRFLKAGIELGYKNNDPNGNLHIGFSKAKATMENGRRCSAAKAFLRPISYRNNLHISPQTTVVKILINPSTKTAEGVEVFKDGKVYMIRSRKEVILSAGAINSPQLLMLSGVGPAEHLKKLNIPVIQNLQVGFNLQDHVSFSHLTFLVNQTITINDLSVANPRHVFNYILNGRGPYTIPGGALGLGFIQTNQTERNNDYPNIEFVLGAGGLQGDWYNTLKDLLGVPKDVARKFYFPIRNRDGFSIAVVLLRPKSRGRIMLSSANPLMAPLIYPNYFQDEDDLNVMVEGLKKAIDVSKTNAFKDVNAALYDVPFPGCETLKFGSDDYWRCCLRMMASTLGHHVGTCKMGPDGDPDAVVDSRLRVRGIKGLRVVDASVMPNIVAGHTNSVVMMIGEKAADFIKEDWR